MTTPKLTPSNVNNFLRSPTAEGGWRSATRGDDGKVRELHAAPAYAERSDRSAFDAAVTQAYGETLASCPTIEGAWDQWQKGEAAVLPAKATGCSAALARPATKGASIR